ncbi:MAG: HAMP domain-containing histidine kinase [Chitinophagaceae bacterium]|nr:HAMP domain-containing histidine kinase [Chitinophagaceae bacterium]
MRHRSKLTILLVIVSLLLSGALQGVWLYQLFSDQKHKLKEEMEQMVSSAVMAQWYQHVTTFEKPQNLHRVRQIFLSPQWLQLRQAFDNMSAIGIASNLQIESNDDSTNVLMQFSLADTPSQKDHPGPATIGTGKTDDQLMTGDSLALIEIKKTLTEKLWGLGIHSGIYHNIYSYDMKHRVDTDGIPASVVPAYESKQYVYGVKEHRRYQLAVTAVNHAVWYRMRYYVASSVLMLLLTGIAFYVIFRLLGNVRLYADAKADFTRNMTHELKTPIATASVALESIRKYKLINDPEKLFSYIDISRLELQRLDTMVEKALNIGSEEAPDGPFNPGLYDVQQGLQQAITSMSPQLQNSRSVIKFQSSPEPCFVWGDAIHLTNIFHNLIENAIKYKGNDLVMGISCIQDDGEITIVFTDNGPGIPAIYHKRIFDKFFRIPSGGNVHDVNGSGLGLYYVKKMIEKHGGSVKVKSERGEGASFIIKLKSAS